MDCVSRVFAIPFNHQFTVTDELQFLKTQPHENLDLPMVQLQEIRRANAVAFRAEC